MNIKFTQKHPFRFECQPCARHWVCRTSKTTAALKIFMGDKHVSKLFQYELASNNVESQTGKFGSPDLEFDQGEGERSWSRSI